MKKELAATKAELTEQAADLQAEIDEVAAEAKHNQTLISAGIKGLEEMILQACPRPISPLLPPLEKIAPHDLGHLVCRTQRFTAMADKEEREQGEKKAKKERLCARVGT